MCYRLMSAWALEYDDDGNGARREARLWGGIQVFAAYLDNQEFPSYNFDEAVE
jgi:hypothetical protein